MDIKNNEVLRVRMNASGVFASDQYFPGLVYKIYLVFMFRPSQNDPIATIFNQDDIISSMKICFNVDNDPNKTISDKYIFEFSRDEHVLDMFTVSGMPESYSYIEYNVDFNVYSILYDLCVKFLRKPISMYRHNSKLFRVLYSWCVVTGPLPTADKTDWTETEWFAFILMKSGMIPALHSTYISQRELFILCYNVSFKTRNVTVSRVINVNRDAYLSDQYSRLFGVAPGTEEVNVNNCLAMYLYQQMVPQV